MVSKNKKFVILQRIVIWTFYLFSGILLYSNRGYLLKPLLNFSRVIYPLSIFWLQIRLKRKEKFLPINTSMTTSQLWFNILPVFASLITIIITSTNSFFYLIQKITFS